MEKGKIIINFTLRNFMMKSNRQSIKTEDQDGNKHFIKLPIFVTNKKKNSASDDKQFMKVRS